MKRIIPLFLLLALLLTSCAPAGEQVKQDASSQNSAGAGEPTDKEPVPATTVPVQTNTDPKPEEAPPENANPDNNHSIDNNETREERLTRLYEEFLSAPVIVPKDYSPAIVHDDPAPETADGYFFGCRNANLYLPAYSLRYSYHRKNTGRYKP